MVAIDAAASPGVTFGTLLKRHRRAAGLSQEALAERVGYSVGHISKLERGSRLPSSTTAELLAKALELTPLDADILRHAASRHYDPDHLAVAPPLAQQIPLVDRTWELAALERHLTHGKRPVLMFAGEPGIGKSRLLSEASRLGPHYGWAVLEGACHQSRYQTPYAPVLDALETYIRRQPPERLRVLVDGCKWVMRLLPELAEAAQVPLPTWSLPPEEERHLMFTAMGRFLSNVAGPAGTLLVLDNLQWADADGITLLGELIPSRFDRPLRVVGAYRDTELHTGNPLYTLLADLARDRLVRQAVVGPLGPEAAHRLLDNLLADAGTSAVGSEWRAAVLRRSAGVPFYEVCFADSLRSDVMLTESSAQELPWDVVHTIRQRVALLPETSHEMVKLVALARRSVPLQVLISAARLLGYEERAVLSGLDTACEARLLEVTGEENYTITNDLICEVVDDDIGTAERTRLHKACAEAMERADRKLPVWSLVDHFTNAGDTEKALTYLKQACGEAEAVHADANAARHFRELVGQLDGLGRVTEAADAREHLGKELWLLGCYEPALETLEEALDVFHQTGNYEAQGRTAALIGWVHASRGSPSEGIERLQGELEGTARLSTRGMVAIQASLAYLFYLTGQYTEQLSAAERAVALANPEQDQEQLAMAEVERGSALDMLGRLEEGLSALEAAIPLAHAACDLWTLAHALDRAGSHYLDRGNSGKAMQYAEQALELTTQLDDPEKIAFMLHRRGYVALHMGDWGQARRDIERAMQLSRQGRHTWQTPYVLVGSGRMCLVEGERERASQYLAEAVDLAERSGDLHLLRTAHTLLAERDVLDGRAESARVRLYPLLDRAELQEHDVTRLLPILAWAHLEEGNMRQAEEAAASGEERATASGMRLALIDALRVQGLILTRTQRWHEADSKLSRALEISRTLGEPYGEAKTLYAYGLNRVRRGALREARGYLQTARSILNRLGEHLYAERVEEALRELP